MFGTYTPQVRVTSGLYLLIDYHTCLLDPYRPPTGYGTLNVCVIPIRGVRVCVRGRPVIQVSPPFGGETSLPQRGPMVFIQRIHPFPKGAYGFYSKYLQRILTKGTL